MISIKAYQNQKAQLVACLLTFAAVLLLAMPLDVEGAPKVVDTNISRLGSRVVSTVSAKGSWLVLSVPQIEIPNSYLHQSMSKSEQE